MSKSEIRDVRRNAEDKFHLLLLTMKPEDNINARFGSLAATCFKEAGDVARPWTLLIGQQGSLSYDIALTTTTAAEMAAILASMRVTDPLTGVLRSVWAHSRLDQKDY